MFKGDRDSPHLELNNSNWVKHSFLSRLNILTMKFSMHLTTQSQNEFTFDMSPHISPFWLSPQCSQPVCRMWQCQPTTLFVAFLTFSTHSAIERAPLFWYAAAASKNRSVRSSERNCAFLPSFFPSHQKCGLSKLYRQICLIWILIIALISWQNWK